MNGKKEKMDELTKLAYEEDGHKKGLEQGLEQGFADGANHEKREIAKSMLNDNLPFDIISKYTNLSFEEIKKIEENL